MTLLVKLGSIAVHTDEMLSADGRNIDRTVVQTLLQDPEVQAWVKDMGPLLPLKRTNAIAGQPSKPGPTHRNRGLL